MTVLWIVLMFFFCIVIIIIDDALHIRAFVAFLFGTPSYIIFSNPKRLQVQIFIFSYFILYLRNIHFSSLEFVANGLDGGH